MKNFTLILAAAFLCGCLSFGGKYTYVADGPQDLTPLVTDYKKMPVFLTQAEPPPWVRIGFMRVQNLPNNPQVIMKELDKLKAAAAKKGADAIIANQYYDEDTDKNYPITIACLLIKYYENLSEAELLKVQEYAARMAVQNASK